MPKIKLKLFRTTDYKGRVTLPPKILKDLGIDIANKNVEVTVIDKKIIIQNAETKNE